MRTSRATACVPGDTLLHPLVFCAVLVLVLNDHVFKARWPSWWTGKLSDVAGLAMFPLLLQGLWEQARGRSARGGFRPSLAVLTACVVLTGCVFTAIKVWEPAAEVWRWGLGGMQWPVRAAWAVLSSRAVPAVAPVAHTMDVTDLLALPALGVSYALGRKRCASHEPARQPA
ncbi:hypothetical protein OWM54_07125 [Myxococcus sp. MISCRS1]|uniref:hypothetical protein n=1 Tax=Myxococcus sp. MISCRS1 TaxID=2996786 RepID=UPI00226F274D|nr:hypothetical protein [Myxococcus sp. MISCRS1]MCY0996912.1 hypothetical protein [Myxococcus sp. MISCRS1]